MSFPTFINNAIQMFSHILTDHLLPLGIHFLYPFFNWKTLFTENINPFISIYCAKYFSPLATHFHSVASHMEIYYYAESYLFLLRFFLGFWD